MPARFTDMPPHCQALAALSLLVAPYDRLPDAERDTLTVEIRPKPDRGQTIRPPVRQWFPLSGPGLDAAARYSVKAGQVAGVQMSVLPRVGRYGDSEHVAHCGALWASIDDNDGGVGASLTHLRENLGDYPAPHLVLHSGGGIHAAWLLAEPVPLDTPHARERVQSAVRRLSRLLGGQAPGPAAETNTAYLSYMLRVPGTHNHKTGYAAPRPVRLIRAEQFAPRQPLVWWRAHLPPDPAPARPKWEPRPAAPADDMRPIPPDVADLIASGTPPGTHHDAAVKIAARAAARGWGGERLATLLETFAANTAWRTEKNEIPRIVRYFDRRQTIA